jgi:acetyl-CoA acetyltransferase
VHEIKIKAAVMTRIGRHDEDYATLLEEAAAAALRISGTLSIDSVFLSSFAPRELCGIEDAPALLCGVLRELGVDGVPAVHGAFKTGGEALHRAIEHCHHTDGDVLVIGCEKMMHLDAGTASGLLAPRVSDPVENAHGATLPSLAALAVRAYVDAYRVPASAFDNVAIKNHANAVHNPDAQFRRAVSAEDVRSSPVIADPLRRLHCAPMSDGAAACVLTASKAPSDAPRLIGWGRGADTIRFQDRAHPGRFPAATQASNEAFFRARRARRDIDVVEIHDAFAPFELMNLEAMGFFEYGDAWRALAGGELNPRGRLAVNPSGGMKARGHPIGVCGLTSLAEIHAQLRDAAGERQQPDARVALLQSAGGVAPDTYAFIVEA